MEISLSNIPLVARNLTAGVLGILNFNILVPNLGLLYRINPLFNFLGTTLIENFGIVVFFTIFGFWISRTFTLKRI